MGRSIRPKRAGSRGWRGVVIACWLLALPGPALARVADLDVVPELSRVAIQPSSGIYFDRPPQDGGTVFIPFATQSGAGVGGPTNGLRAALAGRIRVDFRPDDPTPTLAIRGMSTLFAPVASGTWLPGVPASPATPAAAQAAVSIGSVGAFAMGRAALRDLALTLDVSHPLVATGADTWAWPDGPFSGPTPDVVEVRVADGVIDFGLSVTALTRDFIREGSKRPLVLSAASRIGVIDSGTHQIELRMPLDLDIEKTLVEPVSSLPVRVRLDLDGRLVARNFVPEPGAAAAALAALGVLALLAQRRARTRRVGAGRELAQIAMLALLIGVACPKDPLPGCSNSKECPSGHECVDNVCKNDGTCKDPTDCSGEQTCKVGDCEGPGTCGAPCEADADCESGFCDPETGLCGVCPLDSDGDGVPDSEGDVCPTPPTVTEVNVVGCFDTRIQPDGTKVHCNTSASCAAATPDGLGPVIDAAYVLTNGAVWNGFGANMITSVGSLLRSMVGGVIAVGTFELKCGSCAQRADGSYTCSGDAGECNAHWPAKEINCGEVPCEAFYETGDFSGDFTVALTISKEAIDADGEPSDGSFDFRFASDEPAPFNASIATSGGAGTKRLYYVRDQGDEVTVTELVPAGWELAEVICDVPFAQSASTITITEFDPGGNAECTFRNRRIGSSDVIFIPVDNPDAISPVSTPFGLSGGNYIAVSGSNGFVILDPLDGTIPSVGNTDLSFLGVFDPKNLLGALVIEKPTGDGADAIFTYANTSGASVRTYVPENRDFGATLGLNGTYRDAVHLGDDPEQTEAILTTINSVQRFTWTNFSGQIFPNTATALNNFTGAGTPISAFTFPSATHIAAVTSGTPGKLVLGDPAQGFLAVTVIGDIGNEPRNIRCDGSVCGMSNFGSDSLTIATWDGGTNLAITGTQSVGDGPNGIDVIALDGDNRAIASTGFNDSSYSITVVSPSGIVIASSTLPAPDGCVNPGDVLWLDDPERHLVISCFGSGALAVFVPVIPTP